MNFFYPATVLLLCTELLARHTGYPGMYYAVSWTSKTKGIKKQEQRFVCVRVRCRLVRKKNKENDFPGLPLFVGVVFLLSANLARKQHNENPPVLRDKGLKQPAPAPIPALARLHL